MAPDTGYLDRSGHVAHRRLTVADYHRMGEAGILTRDDRVELIEWELIAMAPIGSDHAGASVALTFLLNQALRGRGFVSVQNPVRLGDHSEPQPDVVVLKPRADYYRGATPQPEDVLLAIEIANSSLGFDRAVKLPLYASFGIPEYWIVDIQARAVEVCRGPLGDRYAEVSRIADGRVSMQALPDVGISVSELFG